KAVTLVYEGHTRRAVKSLLNEEIVPLDQSRINALKNLHPQGPSSLPSCPADAQKVITVDKDLIRDIISREMANGAPLAALAGRETYSKQSFPTLNASRE